MTYMTWVVVADSSKARIFSAENSSSPLVEFKAIEHPEGRMHTRELTSDLPGSDSNRTGSGRHSMGSETDPKRHEAESFAKQITGYIESARNNNQLSRLIIIAAPALLGMLRRNMSNETGKLVAMELDKNLSDLKGEEIRQYLPRVLPTV